MEQKRRLRKVSYSFGPLRRPPSADTCAPALALPLQYELETTLASLPALLTAYTRLLGSSSSSSAHTREVNAAREEIKGTLASLDADIEDLEESVRVVEDVGGMFGLDEEEIRSRRAFVKGVKEKVQVSPSSSQPVPPDPCCRC
jgi:hypothetical protein